jgi:hypothetical protein
MKDKVIVSTITVATTLAFYYYGKTHAKDAVPYLVAGELVGVIMGEILVKTLNKNN